MVKSVYDLKLETITKSAKNFSLAGCAIRCQLLKVSDQIKFDDIPERKPNFAT